MASFVYDLGRQSFGGIASGSINWTNDVIKAVLVSSSYTPNQQNHQYVSPSLAPHTGSGAWSGQLLGTKTNITGALGAANVTFTAVPAPYTINGVALYKESGTADQGTWQLIAYLDSTSITGLPLTGSGADITISWNTGTNKIFKL